jgi:hypothetical protein
MGQSSLWVAKMDSNYALLSASPLFPSFQSPPLVCSKSPQVTLPVSRYNLGLELVRSLIGSTRSLETAVSGSVGFAVPGLNNSHLGS